MLHYQLLSFYMYNHTYALYETVIGPKTDFRNDYETLAVATQLWLH
eukprot:SAG11_NODE_311_length_10903_cov_6.873843_2_plen_46_part_00